MKGTVTFSEASFVKKDAAQEEKGREARLSGGKARRESIDETTFSNQTAFQDIKYEKVLLFKGNKSYKR